MIFKIPYLIVLLYPLTGYFIEYKNTTNNFLEKIFKKEYIWVVFFVFAAVRGNGEGDYFNYLNGIKFIDNFSKVIYLKNYPFEIGFRVIAYINNILKVSGQFTIAVMSFISIFNYKVVIDKYSENAWLSWFFYFSIFILFDMHHTRNAVAMSFIVRLFFDLIVNKNIVRSIAWIILASSFHVSSNIASFIIVIYYLWEKLLLKYFGKLKNKTLLLIIVVLISRFNPIRNLSLILISFFPNLTLAYKLNAYLSNTTWSYPFSLFDPRLLLLLIIYYLSQWVVDDKSKLCRNYLNMVFISILFIIVFSESTILAIRLYNYFYVFIIFIIPIMLHENNLESKKSDILFGFVLGSHLVYFIALIMRDVPYYVFFS